MSTNNFPLAQWADQKSGRWILVYGVLFCLFLLASAIAPQEYHGDEFIQAQQIEEKSRLDDLKRAEIQRCIDQRGPGVVPVFSADGSVINCGKARRS